MPATVTQILEGEQATLGDNPTVARRYYVTGASDQADALSACDSVATATLSFAGRTLYRLSRSVENVGHQNYQVSVQYGNNPQSSDASGGSAPANTYEFNTSGSTETMFVSLQTKQSVGATGITPPNFANAVNVTSDGAQGVQRTVPSYNFTETRYYTSASVTSGFKASLFSCTGKVNNAAWNGFNAGEVLFLGARGSFQASGYWEIQFNFAALPNISSATIGPFSGINKDGWDYLWFLYDNTEDSTAGRVVKRPIACYVEKIYDRVSFSSLLGF